MSTAHRLRILLLALLLALSTRWSEAASIKIISPSTGETWAIDSTHAILWKSDTQEPKVQISFSADAGATWIIIAAGVPNNGRFLWQVPRRISQKCRLRVDGAESGNFAIIPSQQVHGYHWEKVTMEAPFAPRDGAGALVYKGYMWLIGGWNWDDKQHFPRNTANDVWNSVDGLNWTLVKPNTFSDQSFDANKDWAGRHTAGYVVLHGKMWIVGGDANQKYYQNDVWNSVDGKNWTRANSGQDVPWGPRVLHYTVVFHDLIWVMGGQTVPQIAAAPEIFYRDIWNSPDGVHWKRVQPVEPYWSARGEISGSVVFRNRIWILGGGTYDTPTTLERNYYNDVWSSPDGVHWLCHIKSAPWAPRQYHSVAAFDNRMWVLDGCCGNRKDVWYSSDGVNWYELPDTPWNPRHAASVFVYKNALWMVAGNNMESEHVWYPADVWKLVRGQQ